MDEEGVTIEDTEPTDISPDKPEYFLESKSCLVAAQVVLTTEEVNKLLQARKLNQEYLNNELRVVLIGKTGVGKSATANSIIGENYFQSDLGAAAITRHCAKKHAVVQGKNVLVVDTPGIFDTETDPHTLQEEIRKCITIASPGPHAVLFVMKLTDRYKREDYEALSIFCSYFGEKMLDHMIAVFTYADIILKKHMSLDDYINKAPSQLKELLQLFGNRRIAFNNEFGKLEGEHQVSGLITMIEGLKTANIKTAYYNDKNFEIAERAIQEKEKEIEETFKKEYAKKTTDFRKSVLVEFDKKLKSIQLEYEKKFSELRKTAREQASFMVVKGTQLVLHSTVFEKKIPKPQL